MKTTPAERFEKFFDRKYKGEILKLEEKYNGKLTPRDIVREASKESNPLHDWFDWDDTSAGEKYRIYQARILMSRVKVSVMFKGGLRKYRKYLNVQLSEDDKISRAYIDTKRVLNNKFMRKQILIKAMQEVIYWQRCYQDYQELDDSFKGIEKTKKKLKKKKILINV